MKLSGFGENRLIGWIRKDHCGAKTKVRDTGIGDDCAVVRSLSEKEILITTDSLVENIHFSLACSPPELIGEKSVYVNLSDIAAMGGTPEFLFLNLGFPPELEKGKALKIISGIHRACKRFDVSVLGGDTFSTPKKIYISMTVIGRMRRGKAVLRSGARASDILFLTGTVGASALGLRLFKESSEKKSGRSGTRRTESRHDRLYSKRAIDMFCKALPHIEEGRFFSGSGYATAMIDVSDGLSTDLHNLCRESKVGAVIYASRIPVDPSLHHFMGSKRKALDLALSGGEDYCLLITVPKEQADSIEKKFAQRFSKPLFRIGMITPAGRGVNIVSAKGTEQPLLKTGYEHFRS